MIEVAFWVFLAFSLLANVILAWYCRELLRQFYYLGGLTKQISSVLHEFEQHMKSVYSRDMFYGDPTIESLINHSKDVTRNLSAFLEVFNLVGDENFTTEEDEEKER